MVRHSLSYSHADQSLLRDPGLDQCWDGLVVPGTLATFYFEGTGGFVLTRHMPYLIDPRTPLLQTLDVRRGPPKKSHLKLAEIHDRDVLAAWPDREIEREHWEDGRWPDAVESVLAFQLAYSGTATAKVAKYVQLLREAGRRDAAARIPPDPQWLVPPYWAVDSPADPWWALTREAIRIGAEAHGARVTPILTLRNDVPIFMFSELIEQLPDGITDVFCWSSDWREASATEADIRGWVAVVEAARRRGVQVRNLYGGYLSVLLTAKGLAGLNHGVGYSEARDFRRLSTTGAPPTRYYVPVLREFMTVPNAQPVIDHLPEDWACPCPVCQAVADQDGRPRIGGLNTEALKKHFLFARAAEFRRVDASLRDELDDLDIVGRWVERNSRPFLQAVDGTRLREWTRVFRAL
jgi:hypothetical protein